MAEMKTVTKGLKPKGTNRDAPANDVFRSVGKHVAAMNLADSDEEEESDDEGPKVVDEIESLCMNCKENGTTRLLLTKVPFFREIILMSFCCPHCHFKNSEVQSAGEIGERGVKNILVVRELDDFQRQVVKSDTAVFRIEDLDIEIPPGRGKLTNVEGMLSEIMSDLDLGQERRKKEEPVVYAKIKTIVKQLVNMIEGAAFPFTVSLEDPAGNSWIEPSLNDTLGSFIRTEYRRIAEQNAALGLGADSEEGTDEKIAPPVSEDQGSGMEGVDIIDGVMYNLPCDCPGCAKKAQMNIQIVNIPYFKQVILSAVVCTKCGYRTNDVKTGGEITEKGLRIWLDVETPMDLRRDILKSETCMLKIPACRVEVLPGTMGGRFTTVEGLLTQIRDDLKGQIFDVDDVGSSGGDSMLVDRKKGWEDFFKGLEKAINGEIKYTILMEDPLANSYVQSLCAPDPDPQIRTEEYERTEEEDEELGIADMKTQPTASGEYTKEHMSRRQPQQSDKVGQDAEPKQGEHKSAEAPRGVLGESHEANQTAVGIKTAADIKEIVKEDFVLIEHDDAEA